MSKSKPEKPYAVVSWLCGKRAVDAFLQSAGLGITGAGVREFATVLFKPGEVITPERLQDMFAKMVAEADKQKTDFTLRDMHVISIHNEQQD